MTERRTGYVTGARRGKRQNSKKITVFGITFDSKLESDRYLELRADEECGGIADLRVHPKFELQPAFAMANGEKVRAITYTADFEYIVETIDASVVVGQVVVEDVKAWMTDKRTGRRKPIIQEDCELKIKMLKYKHPEITFRITGGG